MSVSHKIPVSPQHFAFYETFLSAEFLNEKMLKASMYNNEDLLAPTNKMLYTYVQTNLHC